MPNKQLTHAQSRAKICIVCFEKKKTLRDISCNVEIIANLKKNVGQNFDISDPRLPTGLCDSCRKSYFSKDAVAKNNTFTIPQYLQFVVVPANIDTVCDPACDICLKARQDATFLGRKQHSGGRPSKAQSPSNMKKKLKTSPINLCGLCLTPKGPNHDSKQCNDVTKTKNMMSMTLDEQGKPNKTGEKIAGKVLKGMDPSPNGTIRLSLPGTGKKLPVTKGAAKPKLPTEKIMVKDLLKGEVHYLSGLAVY